jgi:hypothetical protein
MWAVGWSGVGNDYSPRAFVEFGEHPIGQSLKGPADAVLTGKRQCQPRGKHCAENQCGGHGEGGSMEEGDWRPMEEGSSPRSRRLRGTADGTSVYTEYAGRLAFFRLQVPSYTRQFAKLGKPSLGYPLGTCGMMSPRFQDMRGRIREGLFV